MNIAPSLKKTATALAATSLALAGWAVPTTAQAAPATADGVVPAASTTQPSTMMIGPAQVTDAHAPLTVDVTGGTPGEAVLLDAKHSGHAGSQTSAPGVTFDDRGTARVELPAPAEGWFAGAYLMYAVTPGAGVSSYTTVAPEVAPTVDEIVVSPLRKPADARDSAGVRVTGLAPGERLTVGAAGPGQLTTVQGPTVSLEADQNGVATGDVPAVETGFQAGHNYDLIAMTGNNTGVGRFLMEA